MTDLVVRDAQEADLAAIARILPLAHVPGSEHYRQCSDLDQLGLMFPARETPRGRGILLRVTVAEVDGVVGGAMMSRLCYDRLGFTDTNFTDVGLIDTMAVAPVARRRGVGRALVKDAEKGFRASGARVSYVEAAMGSWPFYQACGYRVEGPEVCALTFATRQGPRLYTHTRGDGDGTDVRLAWKSLTGARGTTTPYTHPTEDGPAVVVRGVIPGDARVALPWPTLV